MTLLTTIALWLTIALLIAGTLALASWCIAWGARSWLHHRLEIERARAARIEAQADIETAKAKADAQIAAAEIQAEAQVQIAREKAQAQERAEVAIAQIKTQAMMAEAQARVEVARLQHQAIAAPSAPVLLTTTAAPPQVAEAPLLPEIVHWRDIAEQVRPGYFAYGVLADGQLIQKPITSAYHTLLHGETRSGKTTSIHNLVVQAHVLAHHTDVRFYMTDVKRELGAAWGRSPLLAAPVQNDASGAGDLITELVQGQDGVLSRYSQFEALAHERNVICANIREYERHTGQRPPLVFVVIDELNALLELAKKGDELQRALTILLQTGAAAGFYVIAGAQYLNAKVFGRDATQQFVSRAHFGTYDPTALRMLFNQAPQQMVGEMMPPGRGFIRVQGQPAVLPFQGVYCDEPTILDVQQSLRIRRKGAEPATQTSPHFPQNRALSPGERAAERMEGRAENGRKISAPSAPAEKLSSAFPSDFPLSAPVEIDPEKAAKVAVLLKENKRKGEIIAEVWGATSGRRYQAANVEYEAILKTIDDSAHDQMC
jgi:hypothetical protein